MSDHHFRLSEARIARPEPLLPNKPRGDPRVDVRRVISGIIHAIRGGMMRRDAPACHGPPKTLCNRVIRRSRIGVFDRMFATLAAESTATDMVMIDATRLRGPPHRRRPAQQGAVRRRIGRTKGDLNSKLHAVCDGKPLMLHLAEGEVSACRGAATVLPALPEADVPIADKGHDSFPFREALKDLRIEPCIPGRRNRKFPIPRDAVRYKQRNRIGRLFGRLKGWRRIAASLVFWS